MPLYDLECPDHGLFEDVLLDSDAPRLCPECQTQANNRTGMCHPSGIIWSNAEHSTQLGVTFTSNAERRKFMRENNVNEIPKGSTEDRRLADKAQNASDRASRKLGFNDTEHRNRVVKAERARGWNPRMN